MKPATLNNPAPDGHPQTSAMHFGYHELNAQAAFDNTINPGRCIADWVAEILGGRTAN